MAKGFLTKYWLLRPSPSPVTSAGAGVEVTPEEDEAVSNRLNQWEVVSEITDELSN